VPDQLGFGSSDKPNIHYSFSLMAANTDSLLATLGIDKVNVIGHSMGGMLAARFALMYPSKVRRLILENPIGLEDYRAFVPFRTIDDQYAEELLADSASLKKYQQSYDPAWKPEYDQYVKAQYDAMQLPDFQIAAWASALTYDMIYQQPVLYELQNIKTMTLLIIGQEDRTVVGKKLLAPEIAQQHGQYPALGKKLQQQIKQSTLIELPGVGHIPHIQEPERFRTEVLRFLSWK
jgi:pimeloyl-ACP methyl ester carboxylesterase